MDCRQLSDQINRKLGTVIRDARVEAGLSLSELSSRTGFSSAMLQRFESGAVHVSAGGAFVIAAKLGCGLDRLLMDAAGTDISPESDEAARLRRTLQVLSDHLKESNMPTGETRSSEGRSEVA